MWNYDNGWREMVKDCLEDLLFNKGNVLGYEDTKSRGYFDEYINLLYSDAHFEQFIEAYGKKFVKNTNIVLKLNQINEKIKKVDNKIQTSSELLDNKNWHEAQKLVLILLYDECF